MKKVLVLQVRPEVEVSHVLVSLEALQPESHVKVVDLTKKAVDYTALVQSLFSSDSVQVL
jgi:hypothetical protein